MILPNSLRDASYSVMAQDNRAYKPEEPPREQSRSRETPESERSKYGDHPFPRDSKQPVTGDMLENAQSPEDSRSDPLIHFPSDPAREAWRNAYETQPHDPSVDYRPPDPVMIAPRANLSMELLGAAAALVLFALLAWVMFHNWMSPSPRHPGEHKQSPGLLQKIP